MKTLTNSFPSKFWTMIKDENLSFLWNEKEYYAVQNWNGVEIYLKGILVIKLERWDNLFKLKLEKALND